MLCQMLSYLSGAAVLWSNTEAVQQHHKSPAGHFLYVVADYYTHALLLSPGYNGQLAGWM